MFKSGIPIVPSNASGTAPDAALTEAGVEVTFDAGSNKSRQATIGVVVTNLEAVAGNPLEVSFNNGRYWFTIATNTTLLLPVVTHRMRMRGLTGAVALYSVMGIV